MKGKIVRNFLIYSSAVMLSAFLARPNGALAQANAPVVSVSPPSYSQPGPQFESQTPSGGVRVQPMDGAGHDVSTATPLPVTVAGGTGAATAASVPVLTTVGTTSTVVYTGGTATHGFVRLVVQLGSSTNVCFNWGGSAAVIGTNCEFLAPGQPIVWGALSNSVTAIVASGTATVAVTQ